MKNRTGRTKLILLISFIIVFLGAYIYLYERAVILFAQAKEIRSRIIEETAKDRELENIRSDIKASLGNYEKVQDLFISKEFVGDFLEGLENLGREIGVLVVTESVTNKELNPSVSDKEEMNIFLTVRGSQENTIAYLKLLELLPYKIRIDNALLQKGESIGVDKKGQQKISPNVWQLSTNVSLIKLK